MIFTENGTIQYYLIICKLFLLNDLVHTIHIKFLFSYNFNKIYYFKEGLFIPEYKIVNKINPKINSEIKIFWYWYIKDWNIFYYIEEKKIIKIDWIDDESFWVLKFNYAKDKNNIYYKSIKIKWTDLESFEIINDIYSRDKNSIYEYWKFIMNNDENLSFINWKFIKAKNFKEIKLLSTLK